MKSILQFTFLLLLATTACKKKETNPNSATPSTPSGAMINSSIAGLVVDENDNPVSGAQVKLGLHTKTTNTDGVFLFSNVQMNDKRAFVTVETPNYFIGSRAINPQVNSVENVRIKLLPKTIAGTFSGTSGGTVTSTEGVKLVFPANAIKYESGGLYTGTVNVAIKHISPTASDLFETMPGNLEALDASGSSKFLETYGMAAIELSGSGGEKLNLANGQTATLTIPVPASYASSAPALIPLWYFDENEGIWKEEGSATFNSATNEYAGDVSHFSFWNCDVGISFTSISGKIMCNGQALNNALVVLSYGPLNRNVGAGITNSQGIYSGMVPTGEVFTIDVYTIDCVTNNVTSQIYTSSIGPFSSVTSIPDIVACNTTNNGTLNVTLKDCLGNPVTNGALRVTTNGYHNYYYPDAAGVVNTSINYCSLTSITIEGYDYTNSSNSGPQTVPTSSNMNFGNLSTCVNYPDFLTYTMNGVNYSYDGSIDTTRVGVIGNRTAIVCKDPFEYLTYIIVDDTVIGSHQAIDTVYFRTDFTENNSNISIQVNFTSFGPVGGKIIGNFAGSFISDINGITNTITNGTFNITRLQ